jgi:hypothetical protein
VFPRLIAARPLSILGDRISEVAIPLAIVLMHRPVWLAGAVTACLFAPAPLLGVQIGSIADRYPRRSLLMAADGGRLLIYLALGPLLWVGSSVGSIAGVLDALFGAALNGYVAGAVPAVRLVRANSYLETADASATLPGPAVSGVILQSLSIIGSNGLTMGARVRSVHFTLPISYSPAKIQTSTTTARGDLLLAMLRGHPGPWCRRGTLARVMIIASAVSYAANRGITHGTRGGPGLGRAARPRVNRVFSAFWTPP